MVAVSGHRDIKAKSPGMTNDAAVCNPASSTVLNTTVRANLPASKAFLGVAGSTVTSGITTTGDPAPCGDVVDRERALRVVNTGEDDLEAGVAGGSMAPLTLSLAVLMLSPVLEEMLADFACLLRGAMMLV